MAFTFFFRDAQTLEPAIDDARRIEVIQMFHAALQPGGALVMEHTQKLPEALGPFFRQVAPPLPSTAPAARERVAGAAPPSTNTAFRCNLT